MIDSNNENQEDINTVENPANKVADTEKIPVTERALKINNLVEICTSNATFFARDNTENGHRLYVSFLAMVDVVNRIQPKLFDIERQVHFFDFDENVPGNGYRSFLIVIDGAIQMAVECSEKVLQKRDNTFFRKSTLTKDIESCSHLLTSLDSCLTHLGTIMSWSERGSLFVNDECPLADLFSKYGEINQHCFFGRNLGFQYCDSIRNVLQFIALSMTLFSEVYYNQGSLISKATSSVVSTTKFMTDPEQRAKRIVNIAQNAEVDFCKAFWFLSESELMNQLPSIVSPSVAISKMIQIPPEQIVVETLDGNTYNVPVPSAFIGLKSVQVRLISHKIREGMLGTRGRSVEPPSKGLMIHCHGGGFVAQSSKSHDGYLREWAKQLDIPILCIDYSLAPEAPFPRALEEVLHAYCWAKKHHDFLGSTGEIIIGAGDSAGANLLLSTTLKCIKENIPTMAGLFIAYVPTLVHYIPSPARLLCMMDPLIPFGFLLRCLKAYACPGPHMKQVSYPNDNDNHDTECVNEEITESDLVALQAHKSEISPDSADTIESLASNEGKDLLPNQGSSTDQVDNGPFLTNTNSFQSRVTGFVSNLRNSFTKYLAEGSVSEAQKILDLDVDQQTNLLEKLGFEVPKDPYLSPIYASEEDLKKFPPTRVLTVEMDPCLDDCVMFAKKLKSAGIDVNLDILSGLPHGFLNFSLFSKEAYEGSNVCIRRIEELLKANNSNN